MDNTLTQEKPIKMQTETAAVKEHGKRGWGLALFLISPIITLVMLEVLRCNYLAGYFEQNIWQTAVKYLVSYAFILSANYFFSKLFLKRFIGLCFVNIVLFLFAISNTIAISITGDPILPADLILTKNAGELASFINIPWKPQMFVSAGILVLHLILYTVLDILLAKKRKHGIVYKLATLVLSLAIFTGVFYLLGYSQGFSKTVLEPSGVQVSGYYTISDYKTNGLVLTFMTHLSDLVTERPHEYSRERIEEIKIKYPDIENEFLAGALTENANVIAIQSESLWDPYRMDHITLSEDPLKNIKELSKSCPSGYMLSPVFGCNTCVPEFEFLTGFSSSFLKAGTYPYTQYIHRNIMSLPRIFGQNGYKTIALHTYDKYFYNRDGAYDFMGFDEFYGSQDMPDAERKGTYISDMEMTRMIIEKYEENKDNPLFLYAVSMQNHGNYLNQRYDEYDVEVTSDTVTGNDLNGLKDAVQGIYDIDKSFYALVEYFKTVEEPTIIVIYGDHLPFLGENSSTFYSTEFLKTEYLAENPCMYETPFLIWANFNISKAKMPERVSPAYLGITALKYAGVKDVPWNMPFFNYCYSIHSVYQHSLSTDNGGEFVPKHDDEITGEYKLIQYDCLSGAEFCLK